MTINNYYRGSGVVVDKFVEISDYILDRVNHRPETRLEMRSKHINILLAAIEDGPLKETGLDMLHWVLDSSTLYIDKDWWDEFSLIPSTIGLGDGFEDAHLHDSQGAAVIVAARSNDVALLELLITEGSEYPVDLMIGDPLNYALKEGFEDVARLLIHMKGAVPVYEWLLILYDIPDDIPDDISCISHDELDLDKTWDFDFLTAIHFAAKYDNVPILRTMITLGFDLEATTLEAEQTALHIASIYDNQDFVRVLLQHIQDVNPQDADGNTPLFYAAKSDQSGVFRVLLSDMRVDINFKDYKEVSILSRAIMNKSTSDVKLILARKDLIIDFRDPEILDALTYAIINGNEAVVKLLVKLDWININLFELDHWQGASSGRTPLMKAVQRGRSEIAQLLLAHPDIDINVRDINGDTVLMMATRMANSFLETILAHPCVDISLRNHDGQTALAIAHEYQYSDVVQILIDAGASE
jgi:ankyrin repeat protein